jgi:hypothetical protein
MSADLKEFLVTFGQKYRREPHPKVKYADPDGWLSIMAYDYDQAREMAFQELGPSWSFIYERGVHKLNEGHFPLGQLHQIVATKKPEESTAGFTIVEVMIIIVIIGLLAAMAIPAIQKVRAGGIRESIRSGKEVTQNQRDFLRSYDRSRGRNDVATFGVEAPRTLRDGEIVVIDGARYQVGRSGEWFVLIKLP